MPPPGPRPRPPPPPGRPAKPPAGAPPGAPPGRWKPPPAPPGRPGPPGRCWTAGAPGPPAPPGRPRAPPGRGAPGRGAPGRGACGRGMLPGARALAHALRARERVVARARAGRDAGPCPARSRTGCCRGAAAPGAAPGRGMRRGRRARLTPERRRPARRAPRAPRRACRQPRWRGAAARPAPGARRPSAGVGAGAAAAAAGAGRRARARRGLGPRLRGAGRRPPRRGRRCAAACRAVSLEGGLSLRATGGSMVDEGLLTNSPMLLELLKGDLAVDTEFGCDLVYAWFGSHNSPVWVGPPRQGRPSMADGSHFEPLISFHSRSAVSRRSACPAGP